jgi:hypothetical protein
VRPAWLDVGSPARVFGAARIVARARGIDGEIWLGGGVSHLTAEHGRVGLLEVGPKGLVTLIPADFYVTWLEPGYGVGCFPQGIAVGDGGVIFVAMRSLGVLRFRPEGNGYPRRREIRPAPGARGRRHHSQLAVLEPLAMAIRANSMTLVMECVDDRSF